MSRWIRFKRPLLGALCATLLVGGLGACSHHPRGPWNEEQVTALRGKAIERISSHLDLNDTQKQKLGVLADALMAQRAALHKGNSEPRAELQALIAGAQFDRSAAQALLTQKTEALQAGGPQVIAAMADFFDSLSPAQQQQVRDHLAKRHGGWGRG